jgi:hypothetical protein
VLVAMRRRNMVEQNYGPHIAAGRAMSEMHVTLLPIGIKSCLKDRST